MTRRSLIWFVLTLTGAGALAAAFWFLSAGVFLACGAISVFALALRDWTEGNYKSNDRQEAMREIADRLGFSFRESSPLSVLGWSDTFELTRDGLNMQRELSKSRFLNKLTDMVTQSRNVLQRTADDRTVAIFDFKSPSRKDEDASVVQTVFSAKAPELMYPHFALLPATAWDKLKSKFHTSVEIHDGYRILASDPESAASLAECVLALLDGATCVEAGEGFVLVYRQERLVSTEEIENFISYGINICSVLSRPNAHSELALST